MIRARTEPGGTAVRSPAGRECVRGEIAGRSVLPSGGRPLRTVSPDQAARKSRTSPLPIRARTVMDVPVPVRRSSIGRSETTSPEPVWTSSWAATPAGQADADLARASREVDVAVDGVEARVARARARTDAAARRADLDVTAAEVGLHAAADLSEADRARARARHRRPGHPVDPAVERPPRRRTSPSTWPSAIAADPVVTSAPPDRPRTVMSAV